MADHKITGGCGCGTTRWESAGSILWAGHCHCTSCRKAGSAPVSSWLGVPLDGFRWTGDAPNEWVSSPGATRGNCKVCGAPVFFFSTRWPEEMHLYAATLDDPSLYKPTAHFSWAERVPYLEVTDDLRKFPGSADNSKPLPRGA